MSCKVTSNWLYSARDIGEVHHVRSIRYVANEQKYRTDEAVYWFGGKLMAAHTIKCSTKPGYNNFINPTHLLGSELEVHTVRES